MAFRRLLDSRHDRLVDSECDGAAERQQRQVGEDADEREQRHGEEDGEADAEHHTGLLDIAPVDQRFDCGENK